MAVLMVAAMLTTAQSSRASDDDPEWYPGLPDATFGVWSSAAQGSMSYARRAKQWFISPAGMTVAEFVIEGEPDDGTGAESVQSIPAEGYFVSPKGAPANYGYLEPMTVRSVGFGMIPVEATVQVSQRRANGFPIPVSVRFAARWTPIYKVGGRQTRDFTVADTKISDSFNVQILAVKVDGVDLGLNGDCRTVEPAPVSMTGPGYTITDYYRDGNGNSTYGDRTWYLEHDVSTYYNPINGGELTGTMTIPPFTGCTTTAGDDLSSLLTLSVSGADNPVKARSGFPCNFEEDGAPRPQPPGVSNPQLGGGLHVTAAPGQSGVLPGRRAVRVPDALGPLATRVADVVTAVTTSRTSLLLISPFLPDLARRRCRLSSAVGDRQSQRVIQRDRTAQT